MAVSGGPQYRPQNTIILKMGTPKKVPLILGHPARINLRWKQVLEPTRVLASTGDSMLVVCRYLDLRDPGFQSTGRRACKSHGLFCNLKVSRVKDQRSMAHGFSSSVDAGDY